MISLFSFLTLNFYLYHLFLYDFWYTFFYIVSFYLFSSSSYHTFFTSLKVIHLV